MTENPAAANALAAMFSNAIEIASILIAVGPFWEIRRGEALEEVVSSRGCAGRPVDDNPRHAEFSESTKRLAVAFHVGVEVINAVIGVCNGDVETGEPLACLDGLCLTLLRTAASSALAASALARADAARLVMIGAGQALPVKWYLCMYAC